MQNYTGFLSEHTIEFVLVNQVRTLLSNDFETIVPIFPWITREGGAIARTFHQSDTFKVLAVFPRRPKFNTDTDDVLFKINEELISTAAIANSLNLPIIAGCPVIRTFWELKEDCPVFWIKLFTDTKPYYLLTNNSGHYNLSTSDQNDLLDKYDIIELVRATKLCNIGSFIHDLRILKSASNHLFYVGGYKPIYFFIK